MTQFLNLIYDNKTLNIAYDIQEGKRETGLFWMSGFLSTMKGPKASALAKWGRNQGRTVTRFDYSGRGESSGRLEDGDISQWLAESLAVFEQKTRGPQVLIGSSMGGWLTLLLMKHLAVGTDRIAGCVLIAPAWNMTKEIMWDRFAPDMQEEIMTNGVYHVPSEYGGYAVTRRLIEDGKIHLMQPEDYVLNCPVTILHGMQDTIVPWHHSLTLMEQAKSDDITLELVKAGEHSLSSDRDIARMFQAVERMF